MSTAEPQPEHPIEKAKWIWPEGQLYLTNCFAHFRKDFQLTGSPKFAELHITADQQYRLWINGTIVGRGPARGYQSHWPFDTYNVASLLRMGANWISVEAYNPGIGLFSYRHEGTAGLLVALIGDGFELLSGPDWKMRRPPGFRKNTARYCYQLPFQEQVDLAQLGGREWIDQEVVDLSEWTQLPQPGWCWESHFAATRPPYEALEPRGIPNLALAEVFPIGIRSVAKGASHADWRSRENLAWPLVKEFEGLIWNEPPPGTCERFYEIPASSGPENFVACAFEMPITTVGTLEVEIQGAEGGEVIDFQFHEPMLGLAPMLREPGDACWIALANRLQLRAGSNHHEFLHLLGFATIIVIARGNRVPLKIGLKVRSGLYPFTMGGTFDCDDSTFNKIHAACRHTQQICALDAYVDTPWREQAQWWGDARIQAKNTFYLDGDARLLERGIRSIAGQCTTQGLTYGHAPTIAYGCILPDFSLTWILTIRDHYWQTGDCALFREQHERILEVLAYFDSPQARSGCGLLRHDTRFWYFGDWSNLCKSEVPTFLNLCYLETLLGLAELAEAAGMQQECETFRMRAAKHRKLVMELLFDSARGQFVGGLKNDLTHVGPLCVHDQVMALRLGLAPEWHDSICDRWVVPHLLGKDIPGSEASPFWSAYLMEEAIRRGFAAEVLSFIRQKWTPMLVTGTTWEGYEWSESEGGTASHAWTSHPSYQFVNALVGITQTSAGWASVHFSPYCPQDLSYSTATVPTPKGKIKAGWRRLPEGIEFELKLPEGVTATLAAHVNSPNRTATGHSVWKVQTPSAATVLSSEC